MRARYKTYLLRVMPMPLRAKYKFLVFHSRPILIFIYFSSFYHFIYILISKFSFKRSILLILVINCRRESIPNLIFFNPFQFISTTILTDILKNSILPNQCQQLQINLYSLKSSLFQSKIFKLIFRSQLSEFCFTS